MGDEIVSSMNKMTLSSVAFTSLNKSVNESNKTLLFSSGLEIASSSLGLPCDNVHEMYIDGGWDTKELNSKMLPASMGTISGVIGKEYAKAKPRPNVKNHRETSKPVKLDSKEFLVSDVWVEETPERMIPSTGFMSNEVEEFLFQMLGDGFQLDMTVIREVLGHCGYDLPKSTEKLLELSSSVLGKHDDVVGAAAKEVSNLTEKKETSVEEEKHNLGSVQRKPSRGNDKVNLQKEIFQSLFSVPKRSEQEPKTTRTVREVRRSRTLHKVVTGPPEESITKHLTTAAEVKQVTENVAEEDADDSYDVLRQAVREHWTTMKEYYKAAVDAFAKGDKARAKRLAEQGQFFTQRAREADERSAQKLIQTRDDEQISLDLSDFEPKTAVCSLKEHLKLLSGSPAIKYLRVVVGTEDPKGARKRLIVKQLEKESIKWTEEKNGEIMLIRVDIINPKRLSFVKNKN